jgi:hypothetical protein
LLIDKGHIKNAHEILGNIPSSRTISETVAAAILMKRAKDLK